MMGLLVLLIALQLADAYTTYIIVSNGGKELNGFVKYLIEEFGLAGGLAISKTIGILASVLVYSLNVELLMVGAVGLYVYIVVHNLREIG